MKYDEFIEEIVSRAGLDRQEARISLNAVIETLGERLGKPVRDKVAAELPLELKNVLTGEFAESTVRFDLEDFYVRVRSRAHTGYPQAVVRTRCILSLLREVLSPGAVRKIFSELPDSFRELFGRKPTDPLSPTILAEICREKEETKRE